jgi:hypothetical protein
MMMEFGEVEDDPRMKENEERKGKIRFRGRYGEEPGK